MKIIYRWTLSVFIGLSLSNASHADREVKVKRFADISFAKTIQYPASVINLHIADIASETSGRIIYFPDLVGEKVEKGQVIIKLDCTTAKINKPRIEAAIKQLMAKRKLTKQQLERANRLSRSSSISREELDQRETQLVADNASIEEQQASLDAARQRVNYCQIKAPFDGLILEKFTSTGSYATPGSPQFKLLKPDAVEVRLEIPVNKLPLLEQAKVINYESSGFLYGLKVRKVLPIVDKTSKQQVVHLEFTSTNFPPGGSYGLVKFDTKQHFIPAQYVQQRENLFGIFIAHKNKAQFKPLLNAQEGQAVQSSLPEDSLIIGNHLQLLIDNEKILVKH